MKRVLLVDGSPLLYQVANSRQLNHLATQRTGEPTGLRYGVLRAIRSWRKHFKCDKAVIVWDSPVVDKAAGQTFFKANRPWSKEKETMYGQLPAVKDLLALTCYTQVEKHGIEADDILISMAADLNAEEVAVIIATADRDMFAAVNHLTSVFLTSQKDGKGKNTRNLTTPAEVLETFKVPPRAVPYLKALCGDKSDNIPGITKEETKVTAALRSLFEGTSAYVSWRDVIIEVQKFLQISEEMNAAAEGYFELTKARAVRDLEVTKGRADWTLLRDAFEQLEFKSMINDEAREEFTK